jgi:hypothetical protein
MYFVSVNYSIFSKLQQQDDFDPLEHPVPDKGKIFTMVCSFNTRLLLILIVPYFRVFSHVSKFCFIAYNEYCKE